MIDLIGKMHPFVRRTIVAAALVAIGEILFLLRVQNIMQGRVLRAAEQPSKTTGPYTRAVEDDTSPLFMFARNPSQFQLSVAYETHDTGSFVYSKQEIKLIQRSLYAMLGLLNHGLWSGASGHQHFIGTASCAAKLHRPAEEVALALLHGVLLQSWTDAFPYSNDCQRRQTLANIVGSDLETKIWRHTAMHGTGPCSDCIRAHRKLLEITHERSNSGPTLLKDRIDRYIREVHVGALYCDEIDELFGGDLVLGGNWKRRSSEHYETMARVAVLLKSPKLQEIIEQANRIDHMLFPENPEQVIAELTPPSYKLLFDTIQFREDGDSRDVTRIQDLLELGHDNKRLQRPYLGPKAQIVTDKSVSLSRQKCRDFADGRISAEDFLNWYDSWIETELTVCEKSGSYQKVDFPETVPEWAAQTQFVGVTPNRYAAWIYFVKSQKLSSISQVREMASQYHLNLTQDGSLSDLVQQLKSQKPKRNFWQVPDSYY